MNEMPRDRNKPNRTTFFSETLFVELLKKYGITIPTPISSPAGSAWVLDGNSNGVERYIGTNDNFDVPVRANGIEWFKVGKTGQLFAGDNQWRNLSIGYESGWVTPDGNNLRNTFIGTKAALNMVLGSDNTIVGSIAMWQANNCVSNSALGTEALYSLTTGSYNSVIGKQTGFSLTTGSNNTLLGYEAGILLTTQSDVTAVGYLALDLSTAGQNDAFGSNSLGGSTTGTNNAAFGINTLLLNATGNANTVMGVSAGQNCKGNASSNVFIGFNAGYNNFVGANGGNRNVFIGESAGQENTGDGNVFIGYRVAQSSAFDALSNILEIHNDDVNNPLIYGQFTPRNLALNAPGIAAWGTGATGVFSIFTGATEVSTAVADGIQMYSVDSDDATATLGLFLEQAVEAVGTFTATNKIKVKINGVLYWIQLDAVA